MSDARLLALDLDGTLADWGAAFGAWAAATLPEGYDQAWLLEENARGVTPRPQFLAAVRERFGLRPSVDALMEDYRHLTWASMPPLDPAVAERLRALRAAGWKVACVTNGDDAPQRATIDNIGVAGLLDATIVSGAVGVRKPDPRILELAAEACGISLNGAWMIGDAEADVGAGATAGARTVWLSQDGAAAWTRTDLTPDHVAPALADALTLVR